MNLSTESSLLNGSLPEILYPSSTVGIASESIGITKPPLPIADLIVDEEVTSVCSLLSPSPPTEFEHPLALPSVMAYDHQISPSSTDPELSMMPTANGNAIPPLKNAACHSSEAHPEIFRPTNSIQSMVDSSSSNSSVHHESAACTQLLSHHYQHLTKASEDPFALQENGGKPVMTGMQLAVHKSTEDYSFLDWNWPLVRKISFWTLLSLLMACVCVVVGMVIQLPTRCDPPHAWWQGTLFYEIFPASFQDHNSDGIGDFPGLIKRADYLESLGVKVVRLNSVFSSDHYPDQYKKIKSIISVDESLGTLQDFQNVVNNLHTRNISVILDLPLRTLIDGLPNDINVVNTFRGSDETLFNVNNFKHTNSVWNPLKVSTLTSSDTAPFPYEDQTNEENLISEALRFWLSKQVDGFYLKDLQFLTDNYNFASYLRQWRGIVDKFNVGMWDKKILMCNVDVLHSLYKGGDSEKIDSVLKHIDLIDVHLDLYGNGTEGVKRSVDSVMEGLIYKKSNYPWIHWNIGSIETHRLAAVSGSADGNLAAIMLNMMLPGTPSIFYGDEIGLRNYVAPEGEQRDVPHPPQLAPMHWNYNEQNFGFTSPGVFPWINPSSSLISVAENRTDIIRSVAMFRESSPTIYMNGVINDGQLTSNCEVRVLDSDILVVQRWYPRRHSYVMVTNLGDNTRTRDLSSWLYGGEIVVDQRSRTGQYVKFDSLTLNARESIIVKLDK